MQNGIDIDADQTGYEIGYGKPPKHSRFKKGQSGNPRGRKRSFQLDLAGWESPLRKYLLECRTVRVDGKKQRLPVVDLLIKRAVANALGGCTKSLKLLLDATGGLRALLEEQKRQMNSADKALIEEVRRELEAWNPAS